MSKEYIERAAAVAFLENMAASKYLIQCFEDKEKFPAADVEPVRHGEWIKTGNETLFSNEVRCSNCGKIQLGETSYCPNCGTCMDGGK